MIRGDVQYRRDGQVLRRQISIRLDGAEHPIPEKPGFIATTVRVDEDTIQSIEKTAGRVARIITYHVLPDGMLPRLVHVFKPDGALANDGLCRIFGESPARVRRPDQWRVAGRRQDL